MGEPLTYQYKTKVVDVQTFEPRTTVQYTDKLRPGSFRTEVAGKEGKAATVFREVYDSNDQVVDVIKLSEDFYFPVHRVEQRGRVLAAQPDTNPGPGPIPTEPGQGDTPQLPGSDNGNNAPGGQEETNNNDDEKLTEENIKGY